MDSKSRGRVEFMDLNGSPEKRTSDEDFRADFCAVRDLLYADTLNVKRDIVLKNPRLLLDPALQFLVDWARGAATQGTDEFSERLMELYYLLDRCRRDGIANTFAVEEANEALRQLRFAQHLLATQSGNHAENIDSAFGYFEAALQVVPRDTFPGIWAEIERDLATAYTERESGDPAENLERAITGYLRSLEIYNKQDNPSLVASVYMHLANAFRVRKRGDRADNIDEAIAACKCALELVDRQHTSEQWAEIQSTLAGLYLLQTKQTPDRDTDVAEAITQFESALEVIDKEETPVVWSVTSVDLATAYTHLHESHPRNLRRALTLYTTALQVIDKKARPLDWAFAKRGLGTVYAELAGQDHNNRATHIVHAITCWKAALTVYTRTALPTDHLRVHRYLGHLFLREKRWDEACSNLREALGTQLFVYQTAHTAEARRAILSEFRDISTELAYALVSAGGHDNLRQAVVVAERGRARAIAEGISLAEAPLQLASNRHRSVFQALRSQIAALQAEARLPDDARNRRDFTDISADLGRAYLQLQQVTEKIRAYVPDFLAETDFEQIRAASVCPLCYLLPTAIGGVGIIITSTGEIKSVSLPLLTSEELGRYLLYYEVLFGFMPLVDDLLRAFGPRQDPHEDKKLAVLDKILCWLWDAVMGPLVTALPGVEECVIIAGSVLGRLPLHAAWKPDAASIDGRQYACDKIRFRSAPSAKSLLLGLKETCHGPDYSILAIDEPKPVRAFPLSNSGIEVDRAISVFGDCNLVLRHEAATREAVMREMPGYPVLHFSCHGFASRNSPLESGLVMAHDEILTLRDILRSKLVARIAVLSSCETAAPDLNVPDEALGLPAGLIMAGVRGVLGSLWPVRDMSSALLMCKFYDLWPRDVDNPSKALHAAQEWMRRANNGEKAEYFKRQLPEFSRSSTSSSWAEPFYKYFSLKDPTARDFYHPIHWAGFCYVGS